MTQAEIDILEKLKAVFTLEQLKHIAETFVATRNRAESRRCVHSVEVVFNEKGYPRHIISTDAVFFAPKTYVPE